ncbi:hypothetical protein QZH41_020169 [Actinostola sp. cb2023]|nr:hypothetical protein QZH41_020169 [Actinostola sp. cb2023]
MQNVVSYFIEREAKDDESSNDYKNCLMKQGLEDEKKVLKLYENKIGDWLHYISKPPLHWSFSRWRGRWGTRGDKANILKWFNSKGSSICKRNICKKYTHGLVININHQFYYQIHLQMFCAECNWTDIVLSDMDDMIIIHINKSNSFLSDNSPVILWFNPPLIATEGFSSKYSSENCFD